MDISPRFALPLIMASQAHKHLTHNEALVRLETLVQPVVQDAAASAPPPAPQPSDCVIVAAGASDAFAGHEDAIAAWIADAWHFFAPQPGWSVVLADDGRRFVYGVSGWQETAGGGPVQNDLQEVGINATASPTNRLTVASDVSLFTAEAGDHRVTVNKAGAMDTASLVFQSGWSGRAEMGLAGTDDFAIKVSADGGTWQTGLTIDGATGRVTLPQQPRAQAFLTGGTRSFSAGQMAGFDGLTVSQGGAALGTAYGAPATGAPLTVPADGLYQCAMALTATQLGGVSLMRNESEVLATCQADLTSAGGRSVHLSTLADLTAGDRIALRFEDAATCQCTPATLFVSLALV